MIKTEKPEDLRKKKIIAFAKQKMLEGVPEKDAFQMAEAYMIRWEQRLIPHIVDHKS